MQAQVKHLFAKWEELERDSLELSRLKDKISTEREYSEMIRSSFLEEISKIEEQKKRLLELEVESFPSKNPSQPEKKKSDAKPKY